MNFLFFFISLPNVLNQDSLNNIYTYEFFIQINSTNYIIDLYHNNSTEFIIKQFPLKNKLLSKDEKLMSIQLNLGFNVNQNEMTSQFEKGNIITDGKKISLYYNDSESNLSKNVYSLIGHFKEIDKLIELYEKGQNSIYINFVTSCKASIVSYENTINVNTESPSFQLFSRNTNPFPYKPYLYFTENNYDLSEYCSIQNNNFSILCTFKDDILKKYKKTELRIIELIPGCELPINTGIIIKCNSTKLKIVKIIVLVIILIF